MDIDKDTIITKSFLNNNQNYVFVFGDNTKRVGKKGAATLRDHVRSYGFITKKYPSNSPDAFFKPDEYVELFKRELGSLKKRIEAYPNYTFLISKLGAGLANRWRIWEKVIEPGIQCLKEYSNVKFLF